MPRPRKPQYPRPRVIRLGQLRLRIAKAERRDIYFAKSEMLTRYNTPAFFADVTLHGLFRQMRQHRDGIRERQSKGKRKSWADYTDAQRERHMERLTKGRRVRDARAAIRMAGLQHSEELEAKALALITNGASAYGAARELAKSEGK